jgi:hypothetical protein
MTGEIFGKPVVFGGRRVLPAARVVHAATLRGRLDLLWSRPSAVVVEETDGRRRKIPVRDLTRALQVAVLAAGLLGAGVIVKMGG